MYIYYINIMYVYVYHTGLNPESRYTPENLNTPVLIYTPTWNQT